MLCENSKIFGSVVLVGLNEINGDAAPSPMRFVAVTNTFEKQVSQTMKQQVFKLEYVHSIECYITLFKSNGIPFVNPPDIQRSPSVHSACIGYCCCNLAIVGTCVSHRSSVDRSTWHQCSNCHRKRFAEGCPLSSCCSIALIAVW